MMENILEHSIMQKLAYFDHFEIFNNFSDRFFRVFSRSRFPNNPHILSVSTSMLLYKLRCAFRRQQAKKAARGLC